MGLIGGIPSVSRILAQKYEATVATSNMQQARAIVEHTREQVRSMQNAGDINPGSVGEFYTQKGHMPSVNEKLGKILDIKA